MKWIRSPKEEGSYNVHSETKSITTMDSRMPKTLLENLKKRLEAIKAKQSSDIRGQNVYQSKVESPRKILHLEAGRSYSDGFVEIDAQDKYRPVVSPLGSVQSMFGFEEDILERNGPTSPGTCTDYSEVNESSPKVAGSEIAKGAMEALAATISCFSPRAGTVDTASRPTVDTNPLKADDVISISDVLV